MKSKYARNGNVDYCKSIGRSDSYLATIKSQRSKRYRYYVVLGKGSPTIGHQKYDSYADCLRKKMTDIYYDVGSEALAKFLYKNKLYTNMHHARRFVNEVMFSYGTMKINIMSKMRKIIKLWRKEHEA